MDLTAHPPYRARMSKRSFPWILAGILFFSFAAFHLVGLVVAGLGCGIAYFTSLRLHPRMRHARCKGSGEIKGKVFTWTFRRCPGKVCQGGRQIRWGAGLWGAEHIRNDRRKTVQAKTHAKENHTSR
jgi:hypothetical protein